MSMTRDYFNHLAEQIEIATPNSQEELDAAETISSLFSSRGLEPITQDFQAPRYTKLIHALLMIVAFVGALLAGAGLSPLGFLGIVLAVASSGFLVAAYKGNDILSKLSPKVSSQNIIAYHQGVGKKAVRGNRKIVILAHYDTSREDLLRKPEIAKFRPLVIKIVMICVPVLGVLSLLQIFAFLPGILLKLFWIVAIFAGLVLLAFAVAQIAQLFFMPCTYGANDNKSGLAAMFGVVDALTSKEGRKPRSAEREEESDSNKTEAHEEVEISDSHPDSEKGSSADRDGLRSDNAENEDFDAAEASQPEMMLEEDSEAELDPQAFSSSEVEETNDSAKFEEEDEPEQEPEEGSSIENQIEAPRSFESSAEAKPEDADSELENPVPSQKEGVAGEQNVRHGKEALEALEILPEDCEIIYIDKTPEVEKPEPEEESEAGEPSSPLERALSRMSSLQGRRSRNRAHSQSSSEHTQEMLREGVATPGEADRSDGLYRLAPEQLDASDTQAISREKLPQPEPPQQEDWGKTSFVLNEDSPLRLSHRNALFDLPEVEGRGLDPLREDKVEAPLMGADAIRTSRIGLSTDSRENTSSLSTAQMRTVQENHPQEETKNAEAASPLTPQKSTGFMSSVSSLGRAAKRLGKKINTASIAQVRRSPSSDAGQGTEAKESTAQKIKNFFGRRKKTEADETLSEWLGVDKGYNAKEAGRKIGNWKNFKDQDSSESKDRGSDRRWKGGATHNTPFRVISGSGDESEHSVGEPAENARVEPGTNLTAGEVKLGTTGVMSVSLQSSTSTSSTQDAVARDEKLQATAGAGEAGKPDNAEPEPGREQKNMSTPSEGTSQQETPAPETTLSFNSVFESGQTGSSETELNQVAEAQSHKTQKEDSQQPAFQALGLKHQDRVDTDETSTQGAADSSGENDEELRQAILQLGDEDLLSHDIWFVALGASQLENAGIKAFLSQYKKSCRGAFFINLNCVGAGTPTILSEEGKGSRRRADRRLSRLLASVAEDLHIGLQREKGSWEDSDATPAMRKSCRSASIVGLDEFGNLALSQTAEDVEDNINQRQIQDVADLVTEAIRRS